MELHKAQPKETVNSENVMTALKNTNICVFMYYPQEKTITVSPKARARYNCESTYANMPHSFADDFVFQDDFATFKELYQKIDRGAATSTAQFRSKKQKFFIRVTLTLLSRDENDKPLSAIGIIEDVSDVFKSEIVIQQIADQLLDGSTYNDEIQQAVNLIAASIGGLYYAIYHIWIKNHTYICFQEQLPGILSVIGERGEYTPAWEKYIDNYIEPEDRKEMREFSEFTTLAQRLHNTNSIIHVYRRTGVGWTRGQFIAAKRDAEGNVTNVIYTVTDINAEIEREMEQEKAIFEAHHDPLTGVYNRKGFEEIITLESLKKTAVGFAILDVDNFKSLNDTYGHDLGDKVLIKVTELLTSVFRNEDSVFRMGGDEFGILLYNCKSSAWETICNKLAQIHKALAESLPLDISVTLSAGMCFSKAGFNADMRLIADEALYETKRNGRAGCTMMDLNHKVWKQWHDDSLSLHTQNALDRSNTSIYRMEFPVDSAEPPRMICSEMTKVLLGVPDDATPEQCYRAWVEGIEPSYIDALWKTRHKMVSGQLAECTYLWAHPKWGQIFVRSGGSGEIIDGMEVLYGYYHSLKDTEIVGRDDDSKLLIEALSNNYLYSYYIDIAQDTFSFFKMSGGTEETETESKRASEVIKKFISTRVRSDYREKMSLFTDLGSLSERVRSEGYLDCEYIGLPNKEWFRARFVPVKRDDNNIITHTLFVVEPIDSNTVQEIEREHTVHRMMELQQKAANLVTPADILVIAVINKKTGETRINSSATGLEIEKQYDYNNFMNNQARYIVEDERAEILDKLKLDNIVQQVEQMNDYTVSAKMVDNDGELRHITYHYSDMGDGESILSVTEDATCMSAFDPLTKNMNKTGFLHNLRSLLNKNPDGDRYALLCFNIQKFKAINNGYGYAGGDEVLRQVLKRINNCAMQPVATCREMADSFLCLVHREKLSCEEIAELCKLHADIYGDSVPVNLNCGIYLIEDTHEDVNAICDRAQIACSACSNRTDGTYCLYSEEMGHAYLEEAYILQNFETALNSSQFEVMYQPIYDAKSREIASAEALVRWQHPERGMISPNMFLTTLEKNGNISELDFYVGNCVAEMQKKRSDCNKKIVPVSVNLSRCGLSKSQLISKVTKVLEENPILRGTIRVEITESGFDAIWEDAQPLLNMFKYYGCKILVDDFGSGYSSLGMLAHCNCDIVKLDMSFTASIGKNHKAEIIISYIIQAIHELGLQIIAEGVETEQQYEFLRDNGCDYIQGFYFSRPLSRETFEKLLDQH